MTHSFDSVASTAFSLEDLKVSERIFRVPTPSGWLLPETTLRVFLPAQGSHAPPSLTSARLNVITTALSTTLPALSRVTETPCLCFLLSASLHFGMTVPEPNEFRQLDTFPRLRNCTPKLPCILHPPGCFCAFNCRTVFCRFLSVILCLLVYRFHFFACQFLRNYPRQCFPWGGHSYIIEIAPLNFTGWIHPGCRPGLRSRIPNSTGSWIPNNTRSRIVLRDSRCPIGSFFYITLLNLEFLLKWYNFF